jgi:hypothetical protein
MGQMQGPCKGEALRILSFLAFACFLLANRFFFVIQVPSS